MNEALPPGWQWARLEDVCDICDHEREPVKREIREARCAGKLERDLVPYYGATGLAGWIDAARSIGPSILLGEDGAPFLDSGKPKAYRVSGRYWVNNHAHILRPRESRLESVILHQLNSLDYTDYVSGTTRLKLTSEAMRRIPIAVPPAAEAGRLAQAIGALLDEIEAGKAALGRAREGLTHFRASLLHAACTGALMADWRAGNPTNETADDLLTAALDLRKKLWQGRYEAPVTISKDMPALPVGWRWATLDQLAILPARNGISVKGNPEPPGVAALRLDAMRDEGLDFTRRRYIDIPTSKAAGLAIREGDFLVSRANGSLTLMGRACVAGTPPVPTVFPDTMIRFRLASADLARWAAVAWRSLFVREHLERRAKTSAGIWKISQDDMRSAPIPLPPSHEITAILEALEKAQVEDGALPADGFAGDLRQAILHAAFSGRLVPRDPADEPAAALLARLRATPAAARRPRARRTTTQPDLIERPT